VLNSGEQVGRYEIISLLGSGGMGEVYLAKDPRIGRQVAIKVLPPKFSQNPDRLRRFEQESRAAGALNHPNLLIIHDVGVYNDSPYIVSEYLDGETLRQRIQGPISQGRTIEYGKQVAIGLAAAHEMGIVHRDLKPENIFITKDERIKILDFGLAKLIEPTTDEHPSLLSTSPPLTQEGVVLGTAGYMSPEQVRGSAADSRSDIFSLGAILYEMLTGSRAFQGASTVETLNAILKEDPADIKDLNQKISPSLERIVRHCLEKNPEARFQSARDLFFNLETVSVSSSSVEFSKSEIKENTGSIKSLVALLGIILLLPTAFLVGRNSIHQKALENSNVSSYRRLTFSKGIIRSAKFTPDGNSVIYGAAIGETTIPELYEIRVDQVESRRLGIQNAWIQSISNAGQMALKVREDVLAEAALGGGAPREILEHVIAADWSVDGSKMVVVRDINGKRRIEFPIGKVIYETSEYIDFARVSPDGRFIAADIHPTTSDVGKILVLDQSGKKIVISKQWYPTGLDWTADGNEVWFSTWIPELAGGSGVCALSLQGRERTIQRFPGLVVLADISNKGQVLMLFRDFRSSVRGLLAGDSKERDLSVFDYSQLRNISKDGKLLLVSENGESISTMPISYLRNTLDGSTIRLGSGLSFSLSPDNKFALLGFARELNIVPTGPGDVQTVFKSYKLTIDRAIWLANRNEILISAREEGHAPRLYLKKLSAENLTPVSPEGVSSIEDGPIIVSPDEKFVLVVDKNLNYQIWKLSEQSSRPFPGIESTEIPIQWSEDGSFVYVRNKSNLPVHIFAVNLNNGIRKFVRDLAPPDLTGVEQIDSILLLNDEKHYVYDYHASAGTLYLISNLK
jgi:eukaryotic-like serine/threonine-protein kinase